MKSIAEQVYDLEIKINALYYSYQQEKRRLKEQISLLRSLCNHKNVTYNLIDHCYVCNDCKMEKQRFK